MQKIITVILTVCILFLFLTLMPVHGEEQIYDSVLRLHVLANSDSDADQALKLKVRDAVLNESQVLFKDCKTRDDAINIINNSIPLVKEIAENTIKAEGYDYSVNVMFDTEKYPTKSYESICFPSGEYLSLRILIGNGDGQNWWCVLYPPMCLAAASSTSAEDAFISVGLNKGQYSIITQSNSPTYNVRFKLLEAIEEAIG